MIDMAGKLQKSKSMKVKNFAQDCCACIGRMRNMEGGRIEII
jgi:hypothetical protein